MRKNILYAGTFAIVAIGVLVLASISNNPALYAQLSAEPETTSTSTNGATVEIGPESNATVQYFTYSPESVEISTGETVTWTSPSEYSDLHTVTFAIDPGVISGAVLPFATPDETSAADFELLPPFNAGEPLTIPTPEGDLAIVALNKLAWHPAVIDDSNETTYLNGTENVEYTLDGTEKALNSGIIVAPFLPTEENVTLATEESVSTNDTSESTTSTTGAEAESEELGQAPPFPPVTTFAVTFEEAGTYPYFCAIHPWMGGQVVVTDDTTSPSSPSQTP